MYQVLSNRFQRGCQGLRCGLNREDLVSVERFGAYRPQSCTGGTNDDCENGKGQPWQFVTTGQGGPPARFRDVEVGWEAA